MSQFASTSALHLTPFDEPRLVEADDVVPVDTAIFEPVRISAAEPFAVPRLRLVLNHEMGGRRDAADPRLATASRPPAPHRTAHGALRLTRRGRVVGVVLLAMIVTALSFALGLAPSQASTGAGAGAGLGVGGAAAAHAYPSVVVQPGDTLWSIARQVAPNADPRITVQHIIERNALPGASIQAGQVLRLP